METVFVILFTVVLLAQIALFLLFFYEKRHNTQRHKAMRSCVDRVMEDFTSSCEEVVNKTLDAFIEKINEQFKNQDTKAEKQKSDILITMQNALAEQENKANERMNNMMLDYTQAQEAAGKINSFAGSLSAIFDYDPIQALQKDRNREVR